MIHGGKKKNRPPQRVRRRKRATKRVRVRRSVRPRQPAQTGGNGAAAAVNEAAGSEEAANEAPAAARSDEESGSESESNSESEVESDQGGEDESIEMVDLEPVAETVAEAEGEGQADLPIKMVVGMRQVDDEGTAASDGGHCRFVQWEHDDGTAYPEDECTWEPFDSSKATLSAGLEGKRIRMHLRGSWSTGLVTGHVEGSMFKVRFSSRDHAVHDLELPPISNYTEWHLEGMSEWENN